MVQLLLLALFACAFAIVPYKKDDDFVHHDIPLSEQFAVAPVLPGAKLQESTGNLTLGGWVLYKQCDGRWGGQQLGTCSLTICQAGCAMSSVAMMLSTKGVDKNPGTLNAWLKSNGGYAGGCNIYWGKVDAFGKTKFQGIQKAGEAAICSGLAAGHGIIANVRNGGHWVLLTGCAGKGVFYVNDPGFNQNTYTLGEIVQEAVYH